MSSNERERLPPKTSRGSGVDIDSDEVRDTAEAIAIAGQQLDVGAVDYGRNVQPEWILSLDFEGVEWKADSEAEVESGEGEAQTWELYPSIERLGSTASSSCEPGTCLSIRASTTGNFVRAGGGAGIEQQPILSPGLERAQSSAEIAEASPQSIGDEEVKGEEDRLVAFGDEKEGKTDHCDPGQSPERLLSSGHDDFDLVDFIIALLRTTLLGAEVLHLCTKQSGIMINFRKRYEARRKELLTFLAKVDKNLELNDVSPKRVLDAQTRLEDKETTFRRLLTLSAKLDEDNEKIHDFVKRAEGEISDGLFDFHIILRSRINCLATFGIKLRHTSQSIKFNVLERLREIAVAQRHIEDRLSWSVERAQLREQLERSVGRERFQLLDPLIVPDLPEDDEDSDLDEPPESFPLSILDHDGISGLDQPEPSTHKSLSSLTSGLKSSLKEDSESRNTAGGKRLRVVWREERNLLEIHLPEVYVELPEEQIQISTPVAKVDALRNRTDALPTVFNKVIEGNESVVKPPKDSPSAPGIKEGKLVPSRDRIPESRISGTRISVISLPEVKIPEPQLSDAEDTTVMPGVTIE